MTKHHHPAPALAPPLAAASQSDGRFMVARTVPLSAAPQLAGAAPERRRRIALTPIAVSIASRLALRAEVEN